MPPSAQAQLQALLRKNPDLWRKNTHLMAVDRGPTRVPALPKPAAGSRPEQSLDGTPEPALGQTQGQALEKLLQVIQDLAAAHGWTGQHTYNPHGPDTGLHVILVRESVLCAEVCLERTALSPSQQRWVRALQATGQVEVALWTLEDLPTIQERLGRPRGSASHGGTNDAPTTAPRTEDGA